MVAEGIEEIALALEIIFPGLAVDADELIDIGLGYVESFADQARGLRYDIRSASHPPGRRPLSAR